MVFADDVENRKMMEYLQNDDMLGIGSLCIESHPMLPLIYMTHNVTGYMQTTRSVR